MIKRPQWAGGAVIAVLIASGALASASKDHSASKVEPPAFSVAAVAPQSPVPPAAAANERPVRPGASGLPVPRWVSLGKGQVRVRKGPSTEQAELWTYVREGLPVEVIAEFDVWRRIRDSSGDTGWVHMKLLSGRRTVLVTGHDNVPMRPSPAESDKVVAYAAPGLVAELQACRQNWCEVSAKGYDGYVPRSRLWGIYAGE